LDKKAKQKALEEETKKRQQQNQKMKGLLKAANSR